MEIYIDATGQILGRMATFVAKRALLGDTVKILNCGKAVVTGSRYAIIAEWRAKKNLTHQKGPYFPTMADRFVRRVVRGMLPRKQSRGTEALKRVMCYIGVPPGFKDKKLQQVEGAGIADKQVPKYVTVSQICKFMGGSG